MFVLFILKSKITLTTSTAAITISGSCPILSIFMKGCRRGLRAFIRIQNTQKRDFGLDRSLNRHDFYLLLIFFLREPAKARSAMIFPGRANLP